ncbi:hypothetical protein [Oxalicibacterium faecigallinarum]|uniref:Uncharacterized protein n=1 Tax=Oxalicibacterium faecigallinarum TaxID=573741 RepID=A0A8J3AT62_9BURK|nr:hypothetical protein [Oxalicibacterium faecigallinarum]GGI15708.1 hypothetical protein GCM10008066_00250 [Oxalicibacterium faecigallinarum]
MKDIVFGIVQLVVTLGAAVGVYMLVEADSSARIVLAILTYLALIVHFNQSGARRLADQVESLKEELEVIKDDLDNSTTALAELQDELEALKTQIGSSAEEDYA